MIDTVLNLVCCFIALTLAFFIGWIIRGAAKKTFGVMHIVEFENGTVDLLVEIKSSPEKLSNGQNLILTVHKTRG